ncbi:MAG: substrate-binding domain-containing protein, partial [Phycisphaerae bacterium]|nr:substrate-binding domain-containing protein [Phycisphaerae bacterium]
MSTDAPATVKRRPTFLVPLLMLIIAGLILWQFGVFEKQPRIALVTSGKTPYWETVIRGARDAAERYEVRLTVVESETSADTQTQLIRDLLRQRYDGIAISPVNPNAQSAVLADVALKSTLVTVDSDSPVSRRLCFVGTDNYYTGRMLGEQVKRALPDGGEVIVSLGTPDKENTRHRRQGLIDELLDREYEPERPVDPFDRPLSAGKYTILETLVDNSDPVVCTDLAAQALEKYPNLKCFVGLLAYSTPAILEALKSTEKLGKVKVVGMDAAPETLAGIEAGHVEASIMQDQYGFGFHAVRILAENARGETVGLPMFQRRTLPCEVITRENVAAVKAQISAMTGGA